MEGERPRVAPSRAKMKEFSQQLGEGFGQQRFRKRSAALKEVIDAAGTPASTAGPNAPETRMRRPRSSTQPLITIANSADKSRSGEAGS